MAYGDGTLYNPYDVVGSQTSSAQQSSGTGSGEGGFGFLPFGNNGYWNGIDFLLPGSSLLNTLFDPTGRNAAEQQFKNQQFLDQQARDFNAQQAKDQRDFTEYMSSTEMQRRVKDLEAAGLNPYLALGSLGGSSSPSGSSAQASSGNADQAQNKMTAAAGLLAVILRMILTKGK